jgi:hypothetical protein
VLPLAGVVAVAPCRAKQIDRARINEIVAGIAALPVVDARSPAELFGYDDVGLPTR